jgi:hypothetical protein
MDYPVTFMIFGPMRRNCSSNLIFEHIPIQYLDEFKARYKGAGLRIRWRGPRKHRLDRSPFLRQLDCTREDAVCFSVYLRAA